MMLTSRIRSISQCRTSRVVKQISNSQQPLFSFSTIPVTSDAKVGKRSTKMSSLKIFSELSKARLSFGVVITAGAGFLCAGHVPFDYCTLAAVCSGTMLCSSSAATFNQIFEVERDASMKRTSNRPLPSGQITKTGATAFGVSTAVLGTTLLYTCTNPVVAALGVANIFLYSGAYTFSKQYTELNTWIGAVVGAVPPVMGWAAATGGSITSYDPLALGALLFLWQFPHFFALSWAHREDYMRGKFAMVSSNDPTGERTANLIMQYSLLLTAFPIVTSAADLTTYMYCVDGMLINGGLLYLAKKFRDERTNKNAYNVFKYSLLLLPALLLGYGFHSRVWDKQEEGDLINDAIHSLKETGKSACLHERMSDGNHLCAKLAVDKAITNTAEIASVKQINCEGGSAYEKTVEEETTDKK